MKAETDARCPIIAGISPGHGMQPPGVAQHAVLIVGYDDNGGTAILNDPCPYQSAGMTASYLQIGGTQLQFGQYALGIRGNDWTNNWRNAIFELGRSTLRAQHGHPRN